jgi:hypothetical protein
MNEFSNCLLGLSDDPAERLEVFMERKGKPMEMRPVNSSAVEMAGYDEQNKVLRIRFKGGGAYDYPGVTKEEYDGLMKAPSFGQHFSTHLRTKKCQKCE